MRIADTIYLDYQASTPTDRRVMEAMAPYFSHSFGNPHSSNHILGWQSAEAVESARTEVANLIAALPEEIIFTSGATEANNHAVFGVFAANKSQRKTVLISEIEHKCVKESAYFFAAQFGGAVQEIPVLVSGKIDFDAYAALLTEDVLLVSVMAVNNEIGTIQDIRELAQKAREYGALFHCDTAQAPEALDVDVMELGVDLLSLSAHKIYGPKGVGALFVESSLHGQWPALIHGGGQQGGMRSGTLPTPLCVGFGMAASIAKKEGRINRSRLAGLSEMLVNHLRNEGVAFSINGDLKDRHPGNLNIEFIDVDAETLINMLQPTICASTGSACNSGVIKSSYVLEAIGLSPKQAGSSLRISVGRYSDEEQVFDAARCIAAAIRRLYP